MPSKSLTLKFGADTSKLDRAMKRLRASFAGVFSARGLIGGAIAGIGLKGLVGAAMNVNEKVANAMLKVEDHLAGAFASAVYRLEPTILRLIDAIIPLTEAILKTMTQAVEAYKQTGSTMNNFATAIGTIAGGDVPTGATQLVAAQMQMPIGFGGLGLNADFVRYIQEDLQNNARFLPANNINAVGNSARMAPAQAFIDAVINPVKYLAP